MAIRHWPQTEQPRFKLLNNGPHSLSDAELIAIFMGSGYSGHSAVDMIHHGNLIVTAPKPAHAASMSPVIPSRMRLSTNDCMAQV